MNISVLAPLLVNINYKGHRIHIAILRSPYLDYILDGLKTIESRFTKNRSAPFGQIRRGDIIFFKESGGPIVGWAIAGEILPFSDLTPKKIKEIVAKYKDALMIQEQFLKEKLDSRYASLIFLSKVQRITPFYIEKHDQLSWVILNDGSQTTLI